MQQNNAVYLLPNGVLDSPIELLNTQIVVLCRSMPQLYEYIQLDSCQPSSPSSPKTRNHRAEAAPAQSSQSLLPPLSTPQLLRAPFPNCGDGARTYIGEVWDAIIGVRVFDRQGTMAQVKSSWMVDMKMN